ncbi:MAG: alpha/beta hydrolase family protein [bacterium]
MRGINIVFIQIILSLILAINAYAGGARSNAPIVEPIDCPGFDNSPGNPGSINAGLSCYSVTGWSKGNHEVNCTIIVPDNAEDGIPLIAWANGWEQGNVLGQCTTNGYLRGLKLWAKSGYVVAAANQWSVQESDVLACANWVEQNNGDNDIPTIDSANIGLAGHSQGGGAVIKAGNGDRNVTVKTVLAMNPYGPSWVRPQNQDGQVFILGGRNDTTTPPESYAAVSEAIITQADPGGINAISILGTHNSDAWGTYDEEGLQTMSCDDAAMEDFANFQAAGFLWWEANLKDDANAMNTLQTLLCNEAVWEPPEHGGVEGFSDCL